ncbi:MAG: class I SAM-dependent methyltransferase [Deltaproteobacteria bacterium]|nr:class I SAM-dependent methyltransferase [Deltaproteobacteria bacterium]
MGKNIRSREYYFTPRLDMIDMIPKTVEKVLDVGCGGGCTGLALKQTKNIQVVGIEIRHDIAEFAKKSYDLVLVGDVERIDLPFPPKYFDCIIYGDILEHLIDPWSLLKRHNAYLKTGGIILVSIPNVRYYKVLKKLIFVGRWDYVMEGILDIGHLRFFTLSNAKEMIEEAGYRILEVRKKFSKAQWLKLLNFCFMGTLSEFLAKQYIILAEKVLEV